MSVHYDAHLYALTPIAVTHNSDPHKPLAAKEGQAQSLWSHRWAAGVQGPELLRDKFCLSNKITDGSYKRLSFQLHSTHISYLQLLLHDFTKPHSDDNSAALIRLSKDSCRALEVHEIQQSHFEYLSGECVDDSYEFFHLMLIEYRPDLVSSERLYVQGSTSHQTLTAFLKSAAMCGLLIKCRTEYGFKTNTAALTGNFTAEIESDPLSRWISVLQGHTDLKNPALKDRLSVTLQRRTSFFHWEDYKSVLGVGAAIVRELVEDKITEPMASPVIFLHHPDAKNGNLIALFQVPKRRQEDFVPGEKASASFRQRKVAQDGDQKAHSFESSDDEQSSEIGGQEYARRKRSRLPWDVKIIRPIPSSGRGVCTALVQRRKHKATGKSIDTQSIPFTPLGVEFRANSGAFRALFEKSEMSTTMIPDVRHSIFCYVFSALRKLDTRMHVVTGDSVDKALFEVLLGNNLKAVRQLSMYGTLSNEMYANEQDMDLNDSQKGAISLGRKAPAGFLICHGGPGTGKTHFVIQAMKPFLLDAEKHHRLLLTSAGNRGVDSMARGLNRLLQQLIKASKSSPKRYVIRLHSIKTELSILLRDAEILRGKALEKKQKRSPAPAQDGGQSAKGASNASEKTHPILEHCQNFAACKFEGVQDERVQDITLSLGEKMLEVLGIKSGPLSAAAHKFEGFLRFYSRYSQGEYLSNVEQAKWDLDIKELMRYTIAHATALCSTVAGAADSLVAESYKDAGLLVVDEASRVPEYQWWPLLAFYPNLVGKIMVGDPDQLPPHIETDKMDKKLDNPFLPQLQMSLQGRLQAAGFKSAFSQRSIVPFPKLQQYTTPLVMGRDLRTTSPLACHIVSWPKTSGDTMVEFCAAYAIVALRALEDLLLSGFGTSTKPCHIAILTPYKEQQRILQMAKTRMAAAIPEAANVTIETVDSVQGLEYDIVIMDLVAVRKPGFLNKNRLNVLFSRARCGLYVVGNASAWKSMIYDDARALKSFCTQLMPYRHVAKKDMSSRFFDSDVLAKDAKDE
ncbi:hypothetical protein LTR10_021444 [Elasticomyces elasticus]|uniref:AAA+ ATPase domain-containing protein n=1 Tax=Exophiala sideris TaxID=1016849 RepID=A0ABR0JM28_9EURO|nr:hypothetical protein LTR10_021444 [Elasticomyces elasticus]KAK5036620.1 hypothetical protein LTS07_002347 [Exophiala sideris]KAK5041549.1 hypothetical protein LTR13_002216 [Exophiala sideris]KAK5067003.1 hypothetical protein LTR69_002351 [Exophiala sideris]KAK5185062.1 hypothetical protein LTR44_002908 [Eurotiomycetes sp. CCFEE 6388]